MTCRVKRCYVHVLALHLDQIFSLGFRVSSCRAADAILPPACRSLSPQTAGRTRPPTRPGKLSGFSDVSQRNLALRGEEGSGGGGVFPSLGGRTTAGGRGHRSHPPPLASPPSSPLTDPPQSPHSSFRPSARPPASSPPPTRPSVHVRLLPPPPPLPPPIISVCLLLSLRVDGRTDLL